ncbi:MAG: DUF2293 domain-containing protein [Kiritimatiellia bacterium]|nr:DUF2293 domain-containing protein [Kiritimatiellia bacterium]
MNTAIDRVNAKASHKDSGINDDGTVGCESPTDPTTDHGLWVFHDRTDTEDGLCASGYGSVEVPEDWEYLPRGNAFLTRRAKKGPHWVLMGSYNKRRGYRPTKGVYAPCATIEEARVAERATAEKRARSQERSRLRREAKEEQYRCAFRDACLQFLNFSAEHSDLAEQIATETAEQACEVHSGRVGRTSCLHMDEKVVLAVRAHIRHSHTSYDVNLPPVDEIFVHDEYCEARANAQADVDVFLAKHRGQTPREETNDAAENGA